MPEFNLEGVRIVEVVDGENSRYRGQLTQLNAEWYQVKRATIRGPYQIEVIGKEYFHTDNIVSVTNIGHIVEIQLKLCAPTSVQARRPSWR